jgi:hypothetical protein
MKRVSFALILVLLSFGLTYGLDVTHEYTGPGIYGTPDTINTNSTFYIQISGKNGTDPSDPAYRGGWQTPFEFYTSGTNVVVTAPITVAFESIMSTHFNLSVLEFPNSAGVPTWDGALNSPWAVNALAGIGVTDGMPDDNVAYHYFTFTVQMGGDATTDGQFCIDSSEVPWTPNPIDWLFQAPSPIFGGPYCLPVAERPDPPPDFDLPGGECVTTDINIQWHEQAARNTEAVDPDPQTPGGITYSLLGGSPGILDADGDWSWNPGWDDLGSHTITICAEDANNPCPTGEECVFTVTVLNSDPVITGTRCGDTIPIGINTTGNGPYLFTADDPNIGDSKTWSAAVTGGVMPGGDPYFPDPGVGELFWDCFGDVGIVEVTVTVTDHNGATDQCIVYFDQQSSLPYQILIVKIHDQLQGHHAYVPVKKMEGSEDMYGFDFLIGYDASALAFISATKGPHLVATEWEYFTYRYNWNGNCGNGCPSGLLRVVAIADENDGPNHPVLPDALQVPNGATLFTLDFLVSNDYNLGGQYVPINFYWMDCGDNTIAFHSGTAIDPLEILTAMSLGVFHYNGDPGMLPFAGFYEVTDPYWGFPTYYGAQVECFQQAGQKPPPVPFIYFFGGGIDIIPPEEIDKRGDVNLNGVANEIADAVVFVNYFIYGASAFTINFEGQKAATEVNGDGIALTVADLVYLIRVIVGDALPLPKLSPSAGTVNVIAGNVVNIDAEVGAVHFVFSGDASVELADGAAGMELITSSNGLVTNALVYSMDKGMTASGDIVRTDGRLISVEAADYNGSSYKTFIVPAEFSVSSYPNPFNAMATIRMNLPQLTDWTVTIYNVVGQKVTQFNGRGQGDIPVTWDASAEASGIYFYKVNAGQYQATDKMVLLK